MISFAQDWARAIITKATITTLVTSVAVSTLTLAEEHARVGKRTRPRFSAGYGDLPLGVQREIFAALDCPKHIGLTLNDSLLMSPTKSVTAIVGISGE